MNLRRATRSPLDHRVHRLAGGIALTLAVVLTATACTATVAGTGAPEGEPAPPGAYVPATDRNADFLGESPLTAQQVHDIATDDATFTLAKFADHFDITQQFQDAATLMAAARAAGNPDLHVDLYDNATFWLAANSAWGSYAASFDPAWLLKDATGSTIAYHGQGRSGSSATLGDVLDLRNPAYRAWAVHTVVAWMERAPVKGITLDSADLLVGRSVRSDLGTGNADWNDLLCGAGAPVDAAGDCTAVVAWNDGLRDLLQQMTTALAPLGDTVTFNGVAPSVLRTPDRNQELFADAAHADNEGFCFAQAAKTTSARVKTNPVAADVAMMQQQAARGHGIVEITNYENASREQLAPYCVGAFLMGWQPGYDYYAFHRNYTDPLAGAYPEAPEENLDLGLPTAAETDHGGVMTRAFAHGLVGVDTGSSAGTMTLPAAMTQFAGGREINRYPAGATVRLDPQSAAYFLTDGFLADLH